MYVFMNTHMYSDGVAEFSNKDASVCVDYALILNLVIQTQ